MLKAVVFNLDDTLFPEYEFAWSRFQVECSLWVSCRYRMYPKLC